MAKTQIPKFLKPLLQPMAKQTWELENSIEVTMAHKQSHEKNQCLMTWFDDVYKLHVDHFSKNNGSVLEIGSGGSNFKSFYPDIITSDVLALPNIDRVEDAQKLSFDDDSLSNITMINVLHHIPKPLKFMSEASRCLVNGGKIVFTEPYISLFSRFFYKVLHHEPCDMKNQTLTLAAEEHDALLDSNQALPTLIIKNWQRVESVAPNLQIRNVIYHSSLSYFLSGGVNYRPFLPIFLWKWVSKLDGIVCSTFLGRYFASFFSVVIEKR